MKTITVYSKEGCGSCTAAKAFLHARNVDFEEVNIDQNDEARKELIAKGYIKLPVIMREGQMPIMGFNPTELSNMIAG